MNGKNQNLSAEPGQGPAAELDPKTARKEAINDMKRIHIMDAALKVIARDGYISVRLEDIAEEAGFSKASIYHYFPDKEALIMHILIREQRTTYEDCVKVAERGLPFLETLREIGHIFYERILTSKVYGGLQSGGASPSPAMMASLFASVTKHEDLFNASLICKRDTVNLVVRIVSKAREDGVLTVPVDDLTVCNIILSFMQSFFMERMHGQQMGMTGQCCSRPPSMEDFDKVVDSMFIFMKPWIKEANHA